jgi:hypothetical protein
MADASAAYGDPDPLLFKQVYEQLMQEPNEESPPPNKGPFLVWNRYNPPTAPLPGRGIELDESSRLRRAYGTPEPER